MPAVNHYVDALPPGYRIRDYEIRQTLGAGGFGITYLAHDTSLDRDVAIKEYLPRDYAVRMEGHSVRPRSSETSEDYAWGLQRFLEEARTLARLDHPSIVRVHTYSEAHGTAYIVMEYIDGETLDERLKRRGRLNEPELTAILNRLIEGLEQVHSAGFLHRDITPKNILLKKDGTPVLIDFGSARQMIEARSRSLTAVVTPGYAPLEQYSAHGKQGPWTDIYGLSAVAYRCITGTVPMDATERVQGDELVPASKAGRGRYSEGLLAALDQGLSLKAQKRPQSMKEWLAIQQDDAVGWLRLVAERGDVNARCTLGSLYDEGGFFSLGHYSDARVVWPDYAEAVRWYRMAAEQGNADAQYHLGFMYAEGRGVPQDDAEAVTWYRMAVEQGNADAQYHLGFMYAEGRGVPQDDAEAVTWYRMAVEQDPSYGAVPYDIWER